ncbi:MAG: PD-(D/E)XK nuclease family protein [Bacteroidia bacterium]|nr:PD-(D/E)XK nuclease family protein [Bacteroidia bacterium]
MKPFLESFADYLLENYQNEFSKSCVIFPSRRAGVFFQKQLSSKTTKNCWLPKITTLNEFIGEISDIQPADQLQLIYKLYEVFCSKTGVSENFDEFYFWGQVILSDFNDIDKELADAEKLYTNLSDLKLIESTFIDWTEEQIKAIQQFWGTIDFSVKSDGKDKFLVLWERLYAVYKEFNLKLDEEKIGYDGKIYRNITDQLINSDGSAITYNKIFVVGFNALSRAEQQLLQYLKKLGNTQFFWDFDSFYFNDKEHEAGFFIRKMIENFSPPKNFQFETGITTEKIIRIFASPTQTGQSKILPEILKYSNNEYENTALVLSDESMLLPVLYSLPKEVEKLNVTMAFPVKQTSSLQFVNLLLELQRNKKKTKEGIVFKFHDIIEILNHSFVKDNSWVSKIKEELIENKRLFVKQELLTGEGLISKIFFNEEKCVNYCEYLCNVITEILKSGFDSENHRQRIEKQVLYSVYRETINLGELLNKYNIEIAKHDTFVKIYKQTLANVSVAFKGEPLAGLQIMGILETRLLDFKNIILLSVNEGTLPVGSAAMSLIPYNLRKGFGLLTLEHQDAIFAYHFYHFLQRSENVNLVYCTKQPEGGRGEASRFIHQLRFSDKINTLEYFVSDKPGVFTKKDIIIERSESINLKLNKYLNNEKTLSPTSISTFVSCPLKFYFRYIAEMKQIEELTEGVDGMLFGSIFHKAIELIYENSVDKLITENVIIDLKKNEILDKYLTEAFDEILSNGKSTGTLTGLYLVNYQILKKYLIRLLEYDKKLTPFNVIGFEKTVKYPISIELEGNIKTVTIAGFIDRCIEKEGQIIVQDFKTGNVEIKSGSFEEIFTETGNKNFSAIRQVIIYSLSFLENEKVKPEILSVRKPLLKDSVSLKVANAEIDNIFDVKNDFETELKKILVRIFSKSEPFTQTVNPKSCEFCDFKQICRR